jgi:hypothetical protein
MYSGVKSGEGSTFDLLGLERAGPGPPSSHFGQASEVQGETSGSISLLILNLEPGINEPSNASIDELTDTALARGRLCTLRRIWALSSCVPVCAGLCPMAAGCCFALGPKGTYEQSTRSAAPLVSVRAPGHPRGKAALICAWKPLAAARERKSRPDEENPVGSPFEIALGGFLAFGTADRKPNF